MTTIRRSRPPQPSPSTSSSSISSMIEKRTIQITMGLIITTFLSTLCMIAFYMPEYGELKDTLLLHRMEYNHQDGVMVGMGGHGHESGHGNGQKHHHSADMNGGDEVSMSKGRYESQHQVYERQTRDLDDIPVRHEYDYRQQEEESEGEDGSDETIKENDGNEDEIDYSSLFPLHRDISSDTKEQLYQYVNSIRNPNYDIHPHASSHPTNNHHQHHSHSHKHSKNNTNHVPYDIYNCPTHPPPNYPYEYPLLDILHNWNPNNTTFDSLTQRPKLYNTICRFDFQKYKNDKTLLKMELQKALNYRKAEVPFIIRDDPSVLQVVKRWNTPGYLSTLLGKHAKDYKTEYSTSNHLMFYRASGFRQKQKSASFAKPQNSKSRFGTMLKDWTPPISEVRMTYDEWVQKASQPIEEMAPNKPHWYFRVNAKVPSSSSSQSISNSARKTPFLFYELPFFQPNQNFYIVDEGDTRGINCRFGMNGNIAEAHFDGSRNFIMLFGGERRYILSHPKNCVNLGLYPANHPSGRHSALDWGNPDLFTYPEFADAEANEVVLQAGDVLYLPTHWFHFIVSLNLNWQCNARSGITDDYQHHIRHCGF